MNTTFVHTLGDSTIDNLYWILNENGNNLKKAKKECVEGLLQSSLGTKEYKVVSHAYDGFTTSSLHNGDHVGRVLGIQPGHTSGIKKAYLLGKEIAPNLDSFYIHPLESLKESVAKNPHATHYVVISVAGNDFRERLANPIAMLKEIPNIHERYLGIVEEVKKLGNKNIKPIVMLQYRLDAHNDTYGIYKILRVVGGFFSVLHLLSGIGLGISTVATVAGGINAIWGTALGLLSGAALWFSTRIIPLKVTLGLFKGQDIAMSSLGGLMETFYKPILAQAKKDNIPVLDLPNTFNPYEPLYTAQIEPNKEGGRLIAEGLSHIIQRHDYTGPSITYAKRAADEQYVASANPGESGWEVTYPIKIDILHNHNPLPLPLPLPD